MPFTQLQSSMGQVQQNLNQIAQICNQLSQNEQSNVSRLTQMQQAERTAAQQLQHCAQLCHQIGQQIQQMSGSMSQLTSQQFSQPFTGYQGTTQFSNWSNRQLNTSQFGPSGQFSGTATGSYPYWEQ